MTPLQILALIGTVASAVTEIVKLLEALQEHPLNLPLPADVEAKIRAQFNHLGILLS